MAKPEDADRYAVAGTLYRRLAEAFMPGPLTVVLPKRDCIPLSVTGGLDSVGIRCPGNRIARTLIQLAGIPVAAPSANLSGRPSPTCARHVIDDLDGKIDVILDGGDCEVGLESTVVKLGENLITVLRPGAVTPEMLRTVCPNVILDSGVTEKLPEGAVPLAPGMKYRHYAPKARVVIVNGSQEDYCSYVKEHASSNDCALCFQEDIAHLDGIICIPYGRMHNGTSQAHGLFSALRMLDEKNIATAYARCPLQSGICLAVYNRLLRAAAFQVVNV